MVSWSRSMTPPDVPVGRGTRPRKPATRAPVAALPSSVRRPRRQRNRLVPGWATGTTRGIHPTARSSPEGGGMIVCGGVVGCAALAPPGYPEAGHTARDPGEPGESQTDPTEDPDQGLHL